MHVGKYCYVNYFLLDQLNFYVLYVVWLWLLPCPIAEGGPPKAHAGLGLPSSSINLSLVAWLH